MKSTFYSFLFMFVNIAIFSGCANDSVEILKLLCTQPDFTANKTVAEVHANAGAVVSQYIYDDIIEAYVVSSDENGNFFKIISFQTLATATIPSIRFSVHVDVSNTYVDFRVGNKVYVKLKN
jgi:hypothetical protein